ncbi:MAG TPA: hypothetical protein PKB10_04710 [Tepidisphaeraceae bacterium]|nr:hypothetical protein [Tepidisphaeraceae bacterium]
MWTGNSGTFTANPASNASSSQNCSVLLSPGAVARAHCAPAQVDHTRKREHPTREREQEELAGGVAPLRSAPDADDEEHRHEREFKEDVEQQRIARQEHADHEAQQREHPGVILLLTVLDRRKARRDRQRHEPHCQQHQPERDGVHPERELEPDRLHPDCLLAGRRVADLHGLLQRCRRRQIRGLLVKIEAPDQRQRHRQRDQRHKECPHPRELALGQECPDDGPEQREKDQGWKQQ